MMFNTFSVWVNRPPRGFRFILQEGIQTLSHLLLLCLLLLGFGGLVFKTLRSGGWLHALLGNLWDHRAAATAFAVLAGTTVAMGAKRYFDNVSPIGKRADFLVYSCLALGLYFAFKLIVTGTL